MLGIFTTVAVCTRIIPTEQRLDIWSLLFKVKLKCFPSFIFDHFYSKSNLILYFEHTCTLFLRSVKTAPCFTHLWLFDQLWMWNWPSIPWIWDKVKKDWKWETLKLLKLKILHDLQSSFSSLHGFARRCQHLSQFKVAISQKPAKCISLPDRYHQYFSPLIKAVNENWLKTEIVKMLTMRCLPTCI